MIRNKTSYATRISWVYIKSLFCLECLINIQFYEISKDRLFVVEDEMPVHHVNTTWWAIRLWFPFASFSRQQADEQHAYAPGQNSQEQTNSVTSFLYKSKDFTTTSCVWFVWLLNFANEESPQKAKGRNQTTDYILPIRTCLKQERHFDHAKCCASSCSFAWPWIWRTPSSK